MKIEDILEEQVTLSTPVIQQLNDLVRFTVIPLFKEYNLTKKESALATAYIHTKLLDLTQHPK